jgi:hypothetical protein
MAKKTRTREAGPQRAQATGENPRRPCPCGSGKRYKACHGAADDVIVIRPFEGLAAECDLVALREFLPSATAPLPLKDPCDRVVTLASVLPGACAALVRPDGEILVGMQVQTRSGDLSADIARALDWAYTARPGTSLPVVAPSAGGGERLQDLLDADAVLDVTMFGDFAWWIPPNEDGSAPSAEVTATLERANAVIMPTEPLPAPGARSAYWVDTGTKAHLRWVRPEPEDALLVALARLHAGGELGLGGNSRFAGSFRAHGLLVPVWDLDRDLHAKEWIEPVAAFTAKLDTALAATAPLTGAERAARGALAGKQITLR